jgi:hypothetical protein
LLTVLGVHDGNARTSNSTDAPITPTEIETHRFIGSQILEREPSVGEQVDLILGLNGVLSVVNVDGAVPTAVKRRS